MAQPLLLIARINKKGNEREPSTCSRLCDIIGSSQDTEICHILYYWSEDKV